MGRPGATGNDDQIRLQRLQRSIIRLEQSTDLSVAVTPIKLQMGRAHLLRHTSHL